MKINKGGNKTMANIMTKIEKQMRNETVNYYVGALGQVDNPEIAPQINIWQPKVVAYGKKDMLTKKQTNRIKQALKVYLFKSALMSEPSYKIYGGRDNDNI
jgi:hypothetical protein